MKPEAPIFYNPHEFSKQGRAEKKVFAKRIVELLPNPQPLETDPEFEAKYIPGQYRVTRETPADKSCAWHQKHGEGICLDCSAKVLSKYQSKKYGNLAERILKEIYVSVG